MIGVVTCPVVTACAVQAIKTMTYKESLAEAMVDLAKDPLRRWIGYGLLNGKGGNGTMKSIPNSQITEMPVAEGLMSGVAQGMAMGGLKPVLVFERFEFALNAADSLVNHLDKAKEISRGEFNPCVIIRCVVGNRTKPLFTGPTHVQNLTKAFRAMLKMPVYELMTPNDVLNAYTNAKHDQDNGIFSTMLVEFKDLY